MLTLALSVTLSLTLILTLTLTFTLSKCRMEFAASKLATGEDKPVMLIGATQSQAASTSHAQNDEGLEYFQPCDIVKLSAHQGAFTQSADRPKVSAILKTMLAAKLDAYEKSANFTLMRLLLAFAPVFIPMTDVADLMRRPHARRPSTTTDGGGGGGGGGGGSAADKKSLQQLIAFIEGQGGDGEALDGWYSTTEQRKNGDTAGTMDKYYINPDGAGSKPRSGALSPFSPARAPPRPAHHGLPQAALARLGLPPPASAAPRAAVCEVACSLFLVTGCRQALPIACRGGALPASLPVGPRRAR